MHVRVSAGDAEYFDAAMRAPLLKRIAEETGGRFFTPANAAALPEAISYSGRGVTVVEERELWDMPALFLAADRPGRRRVGLPARAGAGVRRRSTAEVAKRAEHESCLCELGALCVLLVVSCCAACCARAPRARAADTHLLVITGVAGDEEHAQQFHKWATAFIDAAKKKDGVPDANITLSRREPSRPGASRRRRENVEKAFADIAGARQAERRGVRPADRPRQLRRHAAPRSTCPGPTSRSPTRRKLLGKLSDAARRVRQHRELERRVPASRWPRRAASSSPRPRPAASATRRASPSSSSRRFSDDAADRDRNGRVSVLRSVRVREGEGRRRPIEQKGYMLTEHATIDDGGEGKLAATLFLGTGRARRRAERRHRRSRRCARSSRSATPSSSRSPGCG